jgi:hypothetical protein
MVNHQITNQLYFTTTVHHVAHYYSLQQNNNSNYETFQIFAESVVCSSASGVTARSMRFSCACNEQACGMHTCGECACGVHTCSMGGEY